jgi:hypothetical protein
VFGPLGGAGEGLFDQREGEVEVGPEAGSSPVGPQPARLAIDDSSSGGLVVSSGRGREEGEVEVGPEAGSSPVGPQPARLAIDISWGGGLVVEPAAGLAIHGFSLSGELGPEESSAAIFGGEVGGDQERALPKTGPDATLFGNTEMSYLRSSSRGFSDGEKSQFWGMPGGGGGAWANGGPKLWLGGWRWRHCPCCCCWSQVWAWA